MKRWVVLIGLLIVGTVDAFSSDSTIVDGEKVSKIIIELKRKLEPREYDLFDKGYKESDISYYFPKKVLQNETLWISILWKGDCIYQYEVDTGTYKLTGRIVDLR